MLKKVIQKGIKVIVIMIMVLSMIIAYLNTMISNAAESELTLTPKPETNNIHLKWTGPQNSSYKVYQKKPGSSTFETIGLTDFSNNATDEEVKVLNVYPHSKNIGKLWEGSSAFQTLPMVNVTYLDGHTETIEKSALLKVWMEGRNSE